MIETITFGGALMHAVRSRAARWPIGLALLLTCIHDGDSARATSLKSSAGLSPSLPKFLFLADSGSNVLFELDAATGNLVQALAPIDVGGPIFGSPLAAVFGPDGNLYVANNSIPFDPATRDTGSIVKLDGRTGAFLGVFASGNGMRGPEGMTFGPDGNLYVTDDVNRSGGSGAVLRFDGTSGTFLDAFVPCCASGLIDPGALAFGPDGNLYVVSAGGFATGQILRYDGVSGTPLGTFATISGFPRDLAFGPDGNLYATSVTGTESQVLLFDGRSGAALGAFVATASGGLDAALGLAFGPDGNLYVSSANAGFSPGSNRGHQHGVLRYQGPAGSNPGAFVDVFFDLNNPLLDFPFALPRGLVFSPTTQGLALGLVSGNNEIGGQRQAIPGPLVVRVTDALGTPATGVAISFQITQEPPSLQTHASLSQTSIVTGPDGTAATELTLGDAVGGYQVTARCGAASSCTPGTVTFDETAVFSQTLTLTLSSPTADPSGLGAATSVLVVASVASGGRPSAGVPVTFSAAPIDLTVGGHLHNNTALAPVGAFAEPLAHSPMNVCTTDVHGSCALLYIPPEISGRFQLTASATPGLADTKWLFVGVQGLGVLTDGHGYVLTGDDPSLPHRDNHHGVNSLLADVAALAADYTSRTSGAVLGINDLSLPFGGLFDLKAIWNNAGGHNLHRIGTSVDVDRSHDGRGVDQRRLNSLAMRRCLLRIPEPESNNCTARPPFTACIHYEVYPCVR